MPLKPRRMPQTSPTKPIIYEGVGHAFLMRGMAEDANEAQKTATKAVWERWVSLLRGL